MTLSKHHILICTTSYPDPTLDKGQEAAGSFVADFANALSEHTRVSVIAPSLKDDVTADGAVCVRRFAVPSLPLSLLKPQYPWNWFKIGVTLQVGKRAVHDTVQQENIDHIFALWALPSGYWASSAAKTAAIDYSVWTLGSDIWSLGKIPLVKSVLKRVLKESRLCYADGYKLAEDTAEIGGCSCSFLPSSRTLHIAAEKPLAKTPPYKLAFLGRWHVNKGADLLVDALSFLPEEDWEKIEEIRYCGGGPLASKIVPKIEKLQQQGKPVSLRGFLDQQEATDLFMWADYLLVPSRIESIPVIFSDAMQTITPVITTPVGDLPRLLEEYKVGALAEEVSSQSFAKVLHQTLKTPPCSYKDGIREIASLIGTKEAAKSFFVKLVYDKYY